MLRIKKPVQACMLVSAMLCSMYVQAQEPAELTMVAYIQADNNLAPFAVYNINDMQLAPIPSTMNMLVQWDQPNNNKTWRYRIVQGGRIEDASLSTEMGINPENELVDMMQWAKNNFAAKQYAMILWNHGNGIIDPRMQKISKNYGASISRKKPKQVVPWLEIPGLAVQKAALFEKERGILFDDSQDTFLDNQGLNSAMVKIKKALGKKLDLIGMDACLMAMIEVGYEVKDCADVLVGSQNVEPGEGWPYSVLLSAIATYGTNITAPTLGQAIVASYGAYYKKRDKSSTQSAISLNKLSAIASIINQIVVGVTACKAADAVRTSRAVLGARNASIEFDIRDYIDLGSFCTELATRITQKTMGKLKVNKAYDAAATKLKATLLDCIKKINDAVIANAVNTNYAKAKGLSIYYPKGAIHSSYPLTTFAKTTKWLEFIKEY